MIYPPRKMAAGERLTAANYNALLDYVRRITPLAGANVKVDYRLGGAVISGTPGTVERASLNPFTVRYHEDQWEIYIPDGCVNVGGSCAPINEAASESGDDHEDDFDGWRVLGLDESKGTTGTDSDDNTYREWTVTVHAKTSAKVWRVDDLNAPARRLVWAGVTDRLKPQSSMTDAERYKDTPGDAFSCVVALVRVTTVSSDGETKTVRSVTQLRKTPVDVGDVPAPTGFDLVWYFSVADGELSVEKVYCLWQIASLAGIRVTGDDMTEVTDGEDVYARIDSSDMSDGEGILSVVKNPSGEDNPHASDTLITWLQLYELKENTVMADYREASLKNVQLYRA